MSEVERRHRRVQRVVAVIYLGIPLVLLAAVAAISTAGPAVAWVGCVVPVGMLVLGWILRRRHRYQPRWWVGVAGLFGGLTGLVVTLFPLVAGVWWPAILTLPALILGVVGGLALARYADRVLLMPVVPELADTPYELVFRLRGMPFAAVLVRSDEITIQAHPVPRSPEQSRTYLLSDITGTYEFDLSGAERLRFPIAVSHAVATPGAAVILQAKGEDWVIPTNQSAMLLDVLNRRRSAA